MIELAFLFVGVVFAALLYIHWSSEYSAIAKTINLIPGPPKIPIIGFSMEGTGTINFCWNFIIINQLVKFMGILNNCNIFFMDFL